MTISLLLYFFTTLFLYYFISLLLYFFTTLFSYSFIPLSLYFFTSLLLYLFTSLSLYFFISLLLYCFITLLLHYPTTLFSYRSISLFLSGHSLTPLLFYPSFYPSIFRPLVLYFSRHSHLAFKPKHIALTRNSTARIIPNIKFKLHLHVGAYCFGTQFNCPKHSKHQVLNYILTSEHIVLAHSSTARNTPNTKLK